MKVLIAHVKYRQRGGEDAVVEREEQLLRDSGIDVATLILDSTLFDELPLLDRVAIALSQGSHEFGRSAMRAAIGQHRPDVVHAHNLFPLLGPGALLEAASSGCATVHTWHNYRASCLAGTHLRGGEICRLCDVTRRASGVVRGCYRGSRLQSLAFDRGVRTQIAALAAGVPDAVLCLTDFQRRFYASQGIPADRLLLKPNSVARGAPGPWPARDGAVFVGRLSPEKGILGLLRTWPLDAPRLRVIGDGPLLDPVRSLASGQPNIVVLGPQSPGDVRQAIREAR
ncbi:MAG: glycosyltransferase, partial [Actinobacteria bacterium]|nr:glycosyltransferase [Actinomycetota bacterium]MCG2808700.1 glycosyltransferase [Coriobacteriia bacterium]